MTDCRTNRKQWGQHLFFSLFDIPETISLNLLIFGSVNLHDEENKAVFKSVQTFIMKSNRFTPWHAHIIFSTFSILFNLFVLIFLSKLCSIYLFLSPMSPIVQLLLFCLYVSVIPIKYVYTNNEETSTFVMLLVMQMYIYSCLEYSGINYL